VPIPIDIKIVNVNILNDLCIFNVVVTLQYNKSQAW